MRVLIFAVVFVLGAFTGAHAQGIKSKERHKVDPNKPSVYVENDDGQSPEKDQDKERHWFRFHNNTKWSLRLEASAGNTGRDHKILFYSILSARDRVKEDYPCHVCSIVLMRGGTSFSFAIPRERFQNAYALRIAFSYEWEEDLDVYSGREPTHYVMFYAKDLPQK